MTSILNLKSVWVSLTTIPIQTALTNLKIRSLTSIRKTSRQTRFWKTNFSTRLLANWFRLLVTILRLSKKRVLINCQLILHKRKKKMNTEKTRNSNRSLKKRLDHIISQLRKQICLFLWTRSLTKASSKSFLILQVQAMTTITLSNSELSQTMLALHMQFKWLKLRNPLRIFSPQLTTGRKMNLSCQVIHLSA